MKRQQELLNLLSEDFPEACQYLKQLHHLSYLDLSDRTNLSTSFIFRLLKGQRGCELKTKLNILINGFKEIDLTREYLNYLVENKENLKRLLE